MSADQPTRVLFPLAAHLTGGSTFSALLLMRQLRARGFEPIVALHGDGPVTELATNAGVATYRSGADNLVGTEHPVKQSVDIVRSLRQTRAELVVQRISIVHTNDARLHRLWGPAARSTQRGWVWHQRTPGLSRGMSMLARAADEIVTVSAYAHASLPEAVRARSHVVDNPFEQLEPSDLPDVRPRILTAVAGPGPEFVIGLVSNLKAPRKRPDAFIRIAGSLNEKGVKAAYPVVGELRSHRQRDLENLAETAGCRERIVFCGSQTPASAWIAACDVLIAPAVDEAFGRVLVEAAMLGVPVVAADDGGHREIIEHGQTGFLFEPEDLQGATRAVHRLLDDPALRNRVAGAAKAAARRRFSVEVHADRIVALYTRVLERRRPTR